MNNVKVQYPWFTILITGLLCILKVTGVLSISWWWCFCLVWLPFAMLFAILGAAFCILIIVLLIALIIELCKIARE